MLHKTRPHLKKHGKKYLAAMLILTLAVVMVQYRPSQFQTTAASAIPQWSNPIQINNSSDTNNQYEPNIIQLSDGNYLAVWIKNNSGAGTGWDMYAQKFNIDGTRAWTNDAQLTNLTGNEWAFNEGGNTSVVPDTSGGFYIGFLHNPPSGDDDAYVAHYNSSGAQTASKKLEVTAGNVEHDAYLLADGSGGIYVTWNDTTSDTIYLNRFDSTLSPPAAWEPAIKANADEAMAVPSGTCAPYYNKVVNTGSNTVVVTTQSCDSTYNVDSIIATKIDSTGAFDSNFYNEQITDQTATVRDIWEYAVTATTDGGIATVFFNNADNYSFGYYEVHTVKLANDGSKAWNTILRPGTNFHTYPQPQIVSDGSGGAIVAYENRATSTSNPDSFIEVQRLNGTDGSQLWNGGTPLPAAYKTDYRNIFYRGLNRMISDGNGGAYIAFGNNTQHLGFQYILNDGTLGFDESYFMAWNGVFDSLSAIVLTSEADIIAIYEDTQLYAIRLQYGFYPPTISGVVPNKVGTAGGTEVTIGGQYFTGATAVTVGGTACTSFTVDSDTSIRCTVPAHAEGTVNLLVTTPYGNSGTSGNGLLTYSDSAFSGTLKAQWPDPASPNSRNITTGGTYPDNPRPVKTTDGNYIFAFNNDQTGNAQVYAQKLSGSTGAHLWTSDTQLSAVISPTNAYPQDIVATTDGGAFIAWHDRNLSNYGTSVSKVNSDGSIAWTKTFTSGSGRGYIRIASDKSDGIYVMWENWTPWLTHLDSNGDVVSNWNTGSVSPYRSVELPLPSGVDLLYLKKLFVRADGGIMPIYQGNNFKAYATKVSDTGVIAGSPWNGPLDITPNGRSDHYFLIDSLDNLYIEYYTASYEAYVQKISPAGSYLWNGSSGVKYWNDHIDNQIVLDGEGGLIVGWSEYGTYTNSEVVAVHILSDGTIDTAWNYPLPITDPTDGVDQEMGAYGYMSSNHYPDSIISDGNGGAYFAISRYDDNSILVQHLLADGSLALDYNGINLGLDNSIAAYNALLISDGSDGAIAYWYGWGGSSTTYYTQYLKYTEEPPDPCGPLGPNQQCGVLELTGTTDIFFQGYDPDGGAVIPTVYFKDASTSASNQEVSLNITADAWSEDQFIGILDLEDGNTWTLQVRGPAIFTGTGTNEFTPTTVKAATSIHEFDTGVFSLSLVDANSSVYNMSKDASSGTEANNLLHWTSGTSGYTWTNGHITAPMNNADAVTWDSTAFSYSIATDENILVNDTDNGEVGIFGTGINFNIGIPGGTPAGTYTGTITYTLI